MQFWPGRRRTSRTVAGQTAAPHAPPSPLARWWALPALLRWLLMGVLLLGLWYGVLGGIRGGIHYDVSIRPTAEQLPPGGSETLGLVARLIGQQVDERSFTPNDPFFYPTAFARRTSAFQSAIVRTLHQAVQVMARRDSNGAMVAAAKELVVPPDRWWLNSRWPFLGRPAEWHYRQAATEIGALNRDLAGTRSGQGTFAASRPDRDEMLRAVLESLDQAASAGDLLIRDPRSGGVAVQLADARGTAYAAAILLRGLAEDNRTLIRGSGRAARWSEALDALDEVAGFDPWFPGRSDLVQTGYSLLMAGNAIRSILKG